MRSAEMPGWAWAVLDHRFDRTQADLDARFTVAIATVPSPVEGGYLHEPVLAPREGTVIRMGEPVSDWGWELIGSWATVLTEAHRSVAVARVRRRGLGSRHGDAEPVPYASELAILFDQSNPPFPPPHETHPDRYGSVAAALRDLTAAAASGCPRCSQPVESGACGHLLQARVTVRTFNVWFADQVRAHGWPFAVVDSAVTCRLVAERAAAHPDARFQAQCRRLADHLLVSGDIDPDHHAIIC